MWPFFAPCPDFMGEPCPPPPLPTPLDKSIFTFVIYYDLNYQKVHWAVQTAPGCAVCVPAVQTGRTGTYITGDWCSYCPCHDGLDLECSSNSCS